MIDCKNVAVCGDWDQVYIDATGDPEAVCRIRLVFEKGPDIYSFELDKSDAKYLVKALKGAIKVAK